MNLFIPKKRYILFILFFIGIQFSFGQDEENKHEQEKLPYPFKDGENGKLYLENPIQEQAVYDVKTGKYIIYKKVGNTIIGEPLYMTPQEYSKYVSKKKQDEYYREKIRTLEQANQNKKDNLDSQFKNLLPSVNVKSKIFEMVFGGNKIEFVPQGFASLDLGILYQKLDNPLIIPKNRTNFTVDLQQRIQLSILGKIGNNLQLKANYDTKAGFAFENKMNLRWKPADLINAPDLPRGIKQGEDRIIKNIEFGNVSMPLSTSLITGSQSLFGIKADLQFGKTSVSTIFSEQQSEAKHITIQNGGLVNTFKINVANYEDNQHYYIGQYFGENYDSWLQNYPIISSKINVLRLEVWKIDIGNSNLQSQRQVIALRDLGESTTPQNTLPENDILNLFNTAINIRTSANGNVPNIKNQLTNLSSPITPGDSKYREGEHFVVNSKVRKLNDSEFYFNQQLGYISLNQRLNNDQLLAISFQYTKSDVPNKVFKIGEFSDESKDLLITKLIRPNSQLNINSPMWELMMKNIYQLPASQVSQDQFLLNVFYREGGSKINYIPELNNQTFLKTLNWDRLNINNDNSSQGGISTGDGMFDFVPNITMFPEKGKIIHTQRKPYSNALLPQKYQFIELYSQLQINAMNSNLANAYSIEGRFKGQVGDGISLGAINVPRGSVKVTANGQTLTEGVDYTVDYQLGRVKIINQILTDSGVPINVSLENQTTFNTQKKRFWGINMEHKFSDKFIVGATYLNYKERSLTQKAQYGVEPVNNSILGMNVHYQNTAPFLTKFTNKVLGIKTEAPSNIDFKAETAYFMPGTNNATQNQSYIDDFEEVSSKISLRDPNSWSLASKPENLPGGNVIDDPSIESLTKIQEYGKNRVLASWYNIDPRFYGIGGGQPSGIDNNAVSKHSTRRVEVKEIYNNRQFIAGEQLYTNTLDFSIFPDQRGPYNITELDTNKQDHWAGMMRTINVTNFTQSNVEYMEFWLMDPYADGNTLGITPQLKIQLGNISEDVLKDGFQQYENGLPYTGSDLPTNTTNWGKQPKNPAILYTFSTDGTNRTMQDLGFDGLNNQEETKFGNFTDRPNDPAADDFIFYLSDIWNNNSSVVDRYSLFRNPQGNSPAGDLNSSSQAPDVEDLNNDYNLDTQETFIEYPIPLKQNEMALGKNNIVDEKEVEITFKNGQQSKVKWFLYRIPVKSFTSSNVYPNAVDGNQILNNVRYIRMIAQGFEQTSTLRFATFDLVRADWNRYNREIAANTNSSEGVNIIDNSNLEIGAVNIEENGLGKPPYLLPPGIFREEIAGTNGVQSKNESSLFLKTKNLKSNDARGTYKFTNLDLRRYKKLKLFVSAQDSDNPFSTNYDDRTKFFIRLGSDLSDNYYEYEISLKYTSQNDNSALQIWPNENTIDLAIQDFVTAKLERDDLNSINVSARYLFSKSSNDKKIYVKGRPSVGNITSMMLGIRNNDVKDRNITLWINELRLGEIQNQDGGYAINTNLTFNLADFAQVTTSAQMSTVGFGALDSAPSQRSQEDMKQYAVNANINIDKIIPKKTGIKIPITVGYGEKFIEPKYNPLDNDVEMKNLSNDNIQKKIVQTYSEIRTLGINGLRKERISQKKPHFYDVENFTASFVYSDIYYRDIYTASNLTQRLNASLDYNHSFKNYTFEPFKKSKYFEKGNRKKNLMFIKQINFSPLPSKIAFRTNIERFYNQFEYRDVNALMSGTPAQPQNTLFSNNFLFGWQYNLGFNLTKSFKIDINSATRTLVDDLNRTGFANDNLIWNNLFTSGRPVLYDHRIQLSYKLPLQLIPYMEFINTEIGYTGNYNWQARSTILTQGTQDLGNIAQNSNTKLINTSFDLNRLFNKFKGFKKTDSIRSGRNNQLDSIATVYEENYTKGIANKSFKSKYNYKLKHYPYLFLASFKRAQINYTETNGTILPGFLGTPDFFGQGRYNGQSFGPTTAFLFGSQFDIRRRAIESGWISSSDLMNDPYTRTKNQQLIGNLQIEPNKNLRFDLNFSRNYQEILTQNGYNLKQEIPAFENNIATYSISTFTLPTAFSDPNQIYNKIIENSKIISARLGNQFVDANNDGYNDGYSLTNSDVLIPAFLAAYTGGNASNSKLGYKRDFPLPNWRITYTGLSSIPFFAKYFQKIDISHTYISTYTVGGVQSNINYYNAQLPTTQPNPTNPDPLNHLKDQNGNFYTKNIYGSVTMLEGFNPLIGFDVTMRNSMQLRLHFNKDRLTSMSLSNYTLNEESGNEIVFGTGYIFKDLKLNIKFKGNPMQIKSDLNIRADVSIRDTKTQLRRLIEQDNQIVGGQHLVSIRFSTDYNFSKNLNLKLFYDQNMTKYKISTAYPLSTIRAGISATFKLGN